jgi:hypothetical protein
MKSPLVRVVEGAMHDCNCELTVILSSVTLLLAEPLPHEDRLLLMDIHRAALQIACKTTGLLEYVQPDTHAKAA